MAPREISHDHAVFRAAACGSPVPMLITDPGRDGNPITFVNAAFEKLTLYSPEAALGRSARFLEGPETHPDDAARIRDGLAAGKPFEVELTNHRADGEPYRVRLRVAPIHDADGALVSHVWYHEPLATPPASASATATAECRVLLRELQHRVKNHLAMISSMVRIQARSEVSPEAFRAVGRRIEALGLLYEDMLAANGETHAGTMQAGAYLCRVASVVSSFQADTGIKVDANCDEVRLGVDQAAWLGLLLSEFLTNALVHAFKGRRAGTVEVRLGLGDDGRVSLSVSDDGIGLPAADAALPEAPERRRASGVGGSIVAALVASLGGTLDIASSSAGTTVTVGIDPAS